MFRERVLDMLAFALEQITFIDDTTNEIGMADDFVTTQGGMVLFNLKRYVSSV